MDLSKEPAWGKLQGAGAAAVATAKDVCNAADLKGRFPIGFAGAFAAALAERYQLPARDRRPPIRFGGIIGTGLDRSGRLIE